MSADAKSERFTISEKLFEARLEQQALSTARQTWDSAQYQIRQLACAAFAESEDARARMLRDLADRFRAHGDAVAKTEDAHQLILTQLEKAEPRGGAAR